MASLFNTNPFLTNLSLGGVTTAPGTTFKPNPHPDPFANYGILGNVTSGSQTNTLPTIPIGALGMKAPNPAANVSTPSNAAPSGSTQNGGAIDYTLHPGESIAQYNARIAAARAAQGNTGGSGGPTNNGTANGSGNSTPPAGGVQFNGQTYTPGMQAPPGYSWNPQGTGFVPTSSVQGTTLSGLFNPQNTNVGTAAAAAANVAAVPNAAYQQGLAEQEAAMQGLQTAYGQYANANMANLTNPIPLEFQQGRGQALQNVYGQEATQLSNLLQQGTNLMGAGTAEQSAQQAGLLGAAGAVAPQTAGAFGFYNPATGTYSPYGNAGGGGVGSAGQVMGNLNSSTNYYGQMLPAYNSAANDLTSFQNWLNTPADKGGGQGVNFSQMNIGNQLQSWLQGGNFSDPRFPELNTFLNDFTNKLSGIVGANSGEITNYKQQLVNSMLDPTATPQSIISQANTLMNVAQQTLKGVYNTFNMQGSGNPNTLPSYGGTTQSGGTGANTATVNIGGMGFTQNAQGQWVPA